MLSRDLKSLDGDMGRKITLRRSEQVVITVETEKLPIEFVKIKLEVDKAAIKAELKKGIVIEGCYIKENQNVGWK